MLKQLPAKNKYNFLDVEATSVFSDEIREVCTIFCPQKKHNILEPYWIDFCIRFDIINESRKQ